MPRNSTTTDHVADMQATTARAARPRKTPEQKLAEARAKAMRAEFDVLAARGAAAKMGAKAVAAIKAAPEVHYLLAADADSIDAWLIVARGHVEAAEIERIGRYVSVNNGIEEVDPVYPPEGSP